MHGETLKKIAFTVYIKLRMYNKFGSKGHKYICVCVCVCDELRHCRLNTDCGTKITAVEARLAFFRQKRKRIPIIGYLF
jgi:hypothetical protein